VEADGDTPTFSPLFLENIL
jgi:hypothetical protein